jgi:primase-polymerase (primpol)-like protein
MQPNALPVRLREHAQWVCWGSRDRNGKSTKVPLDPASGTFASTADPDTWGTFDDALAHARRPDVSGIGFVFTDDDPYVGIDLDDCREPDASDLTDEAIEIVTRLQSYTEVSPSGTGLHVIVRGRLPDGKRRHGSVEMYDEGRFFTMTGEQLPGTPDEVCERPNALRTVHQTYVAESPSEQSETTTATQSPDSERELTFSADLDDEEVIEKGKSAANGEKFTALWNGQTGRYESHSEADMALCCLLAFWTDGDPDQVDRLFRQSGLMRPKWDEVHYSNGATYGEKTVERACTRVTEYYSDSA